MALGAAVRLGWESWPETGSSVTVSLIADRRIAELGTAQVAPSHWEVASPGVGGAEAPSPSGLGRRCLGAYRRGPSPLGEPACAGRCSVQRAARCTGRGCSSKRI
eukprot:2996752-Alexandrium_andersonii.AAC.1